MPEALKIIQITDLHLLADADAVLHGWPVDHAWRHAFDDARRRHPDVDAWALTGDLVDDESEQGYIRLNQQLAGLQQPVLALIGNHDHTATAEQQLTHAHVHTHIELGGWRLISLNTHIDGSDAGRLGTRQLHHLQRLLQADECPCVLFLHHPPVHLGSRWLDAIGLRDADYLCQLIQSHSHIAAVVCGHTHQAFAAHIGHAPCWGTPSTMRQFLPHANEFAIDAEARPGYRVIRLQADGGVHSWVQRLTPTCGQLWG